MLQEPMMEKLTAMRLLGMLDVLKAQEQDPAAGELSFLERLGLLMSSAALPVEIIPGYCETVRLPAGISFTFPRNPQRTHSAPVL